MPQKNQASKEAEAEFCRVLHEKNLVLVVGSGISRQINKGSLDWPAMLQSGLKYASLSPEHTSAINVLIKSGDLDLMLAAAEAIKTKLESKPGRWEEWLENAFAPSPDGSPSSQKIIDALRGLPARILTTNYDLLLEDSLGFSPLTFETGGEVLKWVGDNDGKARKILHIHGCLTKPQTVVLSPRDYQQHVNDALAQKAQDALFVTSTLLFIGCGDTMNDPNLGPCAERLEFLFTKAGKQHFWARRRQDAGKYPQPQFITELVYGDNYDDLAESILSLGPRRPTSAPSRVPEHYIETKQNTTERERFVDRLLKDQPDQLYVFGRVGVGRQTFVHKALEKINPSPIVIRCAKLTGWPMLLREIERAIWTSSHFENDPKLRITHFLAHTPSILLLTDCDDLFKSNNPDITRDIRALTEPTKTKIIYTLRETTWPKGVDNDVRFELTPLNGAEVETLLMALADRKVLKDKSFITEAVKHATGLPAFVQLIAAFTRGIRLFQGRNLAEKLLNRVRSEKLEPEANEVFIFRLLLEDLTPIERQVLALAAEMPSGVDQQDIQELVKPKEVDYIKLSDLTSGGLDACRIEVSVFVSRIFDSHLFNCETLKIEYLSYLLSKMRLSAAVTAYFRIRPAKWEQDISNIEHCIGKLLRARRAGKVDANVKELIARAAECAELLKEDKLAAECLMEKGKLAHLDAEYLLARKSFVEASKLFGDDHERSASCDVNMASLCFELEQYQSAEGLIANAKTKLDSLREEQNWKSLFECELLLIQIALARHRFANAFDFEGWKQRYKLEKIGRIEARLKKLAESYEHRGLAIAQATCLRLLGDASLLRGGNGDEYYDRALPLCEGHSLGQANCYRGKAEQALSLDPPKVEEARTNIGYARKKYQDVAARRGEAICDRREGDIANAEVGVIRSFHGPEAAEEKLKERDTAYEKAIANFIAIGDHCAAGWTFMARLLASGGFGFRDGWKTSGSAEADGFFNSMIEQWKLGRRPDLVKLFANKRPRLS